jgi:FHA domain
VNSVRSYKPGDWFGIVGERAVVILPPTEKARVAALWELVDGGAGFDVTLDALIYGGLRDLPAFVLVSTGEGETRVVIRGPARAEFRVEGETVALEGSDATTWVERSLAEVERMSIVLHEDPLGMDPASYVVDGGLFRISRLDEAPAHEGPDEIAEEPAYVREFPLDDEADDAGADEDDQVEDYGGEPIPPVRSPEPPDWIPAPPVAPPTPPAPPAPPVLPPVPDAPPTEAMVGPPADTDHDGLTVTGAWQPPPPAPPGIPGQPPAPDVTVAVARLLISNGDVIDVDRAVVIGRAPEARRVNDTEQPKLVTVPSPHLEISSTHIEVRPGSGADHGSAVVTDLGSTNGTVVVQPGLGPEDLSPGVAVQLIPGAIIDLGDGVTIQVTRP